MQIFLILALLISILVVIFAVQNVAVVTISFFALNAQVPLAVALLAALAAGVLITLLVSIPGKIKGSWSSASNRKKYTNLEAERDRLKIKLEEAAAEREQNVKKLAESEQEISSLEEALANLSAALQENDKGLDQPAPRMLPPESEPNESSRPQ